MSSSSSLRLYLYTPQSIKVHQEFWDWGWVCVVRAHLTNQVDGRLHLTKLIGLSIQQTQHTTGQSADLVSNAGQRLGGEVFSFLQSLHAAVTSLKYTES